ncbi:MAG: glucans biosynthesis glucosyltransferase MdoH [Pseudomonadota bacterium]
MSIAHHIKGTNVARPKTGFARPRPALLAFLVLLGLFSAILILAFARAVDTWNWVAWSVLPLIAFNAIWISGGAATSVLGLLSPKAKRMEPHETPTPRGETAILITLCGEPPEPVATYLQGLAVGLKTIGLGAKTKIFVLSDTEAGPVATREEAVLAGLIEAGDVIYRRRTVRTDRKPGNISDWLATHGTSFDYMVVLDADSRMSPDSINHLISEMETNPGLGLCQASISLVPARTRFGKYQRVTSRLLSRTFGQGFAAWSGDCGNYWGHNAIIRVSAFRAAAHLPRLSGSAPFGGSILSHDFIEAAWIRRAGWRVALCPNLPGSAEDAPQTLGEFFKRDRRWCQGNLQHMRLLGEPGLHALSRFHLLSGIFSYLAAPIWLLLLALLSSGQIEIWGFLPVLLIALVLLVPKLCALIEAMPRAKTARRRRTLARAWGHELVLSTVLAPIIMLRQASFVASIAMGRDCGWKSAETKRLDLPQGWAEAGIGLAMLALALVNGTQGVFWLALVILPLLSAPILMPKLDEVAR